MAAAALSIASRSTCRPVFSWTARAATTVHACHAPVLGTAIGPETPGFVLWRLKISQIAPILPYVFLVLILVFRPKGLLGTREG